MNFYHIIAYFVNLKGKRVRKRAINLWWVDCTPDRAAFRL